MFNGNGRDSTINIAKSTTANFPSHTIRIICFFPFSRVLLLFIFILLLVNCCQSQNSNNSSLCVSSCGNIRNISSPFRLKGDSSNCGHPNFELDCQNNQTVVTFSYYSVYRNMESSENFYFTRPSSKKYLVQSINYNNLTIRVVDPGLINPTTNCSFPVNSAMDLYYAISNGEYSLAWYYNGYMFDKHEYNLPIVFISCVDPISYSSSTRFIDISFCRARGTQNTTGFWNRPKTYGYVNFDMEISKLPETCGVEHVAFSSVNGPLAEKNSSLVDIHQGLAYGFELSWYLLLCSDCAAANLGCSVQGNSTNISCYNGEYSSCPADSAFLAVYVDLSHFQFTSSHLQIYFNSFSRRTRQFYDAITPSHPGIRFSCYFSFWIRGLGELVIIVIGGLLILRFCIGFVCLMVLVVRKWRKRHLSGDETIKDFLQGQTNLLPIKYSYADIKMMTNKFNHKLGEGGYGIVYIGKLRSGPLVAVKITNKSISSEREFSNEVGTIGRVHHVNVEQLIGFCSEGSKHALVYKYMPNGSLDKYISPTAGLVALTYKNMFDISLGVARGIDYLHKGCDMQILHFDIKPHNILLDEDFKPKVSDFGLAKLYPTDVNTVTLPTTTARGTTGYMAPELFYKNIGGVSYKADVYSFGMLLMEIASRKENINPFAEDVGQIYFPSWVYDQLNAGKEIDMGNVSDEEKMMVKKMIKVALWCIQMKPSNRPSMNRVVEMLEGDTELVHMRPRPFIAPME